MQAQQWTNNKKHYKISEQTLSMWSGSYLMIPCLFNMWYASLTFGSWAKTWLHPYNNSMHFSLTRSDTWLPRYYNNNNYYYYSYNDCSQS